MTRPLPREEHQTVTDARTRHHAWIREHGTDMPEVADRTWTGRAFSQPHR
ncbi:hypothetical protein AB0I22_28245 [Streptomyces sp. NPDC050610]